MAYEKKDMTGALFQNDRRTRDTQPDLQGYVILNGVEYWLSGWNKTGQRGEYISLSLKAKEDRDQPPPRRQQSISERAMPSGPRYADDRITTGRQRSDEDVPF